MKYKHIIWDWNGTLLDDRNFCIDIMNNVLRRRGMNKMTESWFLENFCFPVKDYYKKLGFDLEKEPFEISGDEFIDEYMERIDEPDLHESASEVLRAIDEMGVDQSLLSASAQSMLDEILKNHQIKTYFVRVLGQNNHYAYGKEEMGKQWVRELELQQHEVLFVGDTLHDKEVADLIGSDCVLISNGHVSERRLKETDALVLKDLRDIIPLLNGSN